MWTGQKVIAYAGNEQLRIGFIVEPNPNDEGKYGVQVGGDIFGLNHDETAAEGNRGGTFRLNKPAQAQ